MRPIVLCDLALCYRAASEYDCLSMSALEKFALRMTVWIAALGALIHLAAIIGGPAWFRFFGAPPFIVASAEQATWLAPVASLIIAALMATCAWYAAAVLGWLPRPFLHKTGLAVMAVICIARALLLPILAWRLPGLWTAFEIIAALVWLLAGVGFAFGLRALWRKPASN